MSFFIVKIDNIFVNPRESFGWILLNPEFICAIGTVSSYLGNWRKRVNFSNSVAEIQQKYEREREKKWKKILIFGNHVTEIPVAQTWPQTNCGNGIAEIGKKKICGNAITKNWRKKIK